MVNENKDIVVATTGVKEPIKEKCSCKPAGCGGRDIYCVTHGKKAE